MIPLNDELEEWLARRRLRRLRMVLTRDPYAAVAMLTLCYAFLTSTDCIYWQGITWVAGPYTSSAGGVLNTGGNLAGIVGTPLTALLFAQFGWTAALGAGVVFALLAATLWLFISVDEPLIAAGHDRRHLG